MNIKETVNKVESRLLEGANRDDIFRELGGTDDVARVIASTPDFQLRQKYAKLNWVLVSIITYFALFKLIDSISVFLDNKLPLYFFPMLLFVPGVAIYFAIQIKIFRGGFYLIAGLLLIAVTINSGKTFDSMMINARSVGLWIAFYSPLVAGCIIAFFLKRKLCPHLGYMGAKTDSSGNYKFINNNG